MKKKLSKDVGAILPNIIRNKGWEVELERYELFRNWRQLLGEEIADHTKPVKVERNVLWVEVENSVWIQQLQYQKLWILGELNNQLLLSRLADIRFILEQHKPVVKEKPRERLRFEPPAPEDFERFCAQTEWIEDEASREALRNFWYLSHACKKETEKD